MSFGGFPREALAFLAGLERDNERTWFEAHREEYEHTLLEPARDFVVELGDELRTRGLEVEADPRVNRSIRRIARDTRFSRDKRPYKTHLDLWFWHGGGESGDSPGLWFRMAPRTLTLGAGMHRFGKDVLERYREAVAGDERGGAAQHAVATVEAAGAQVGGRSYKRVPRGFDPNHERADLLRHDGLYAGSERPVPAAVHGPEFVPYCADDYERLAPLLRWLIELVDAR